MGDPFLGNVEIEGGKNSDCIFCDTDFDAWHWILFDIVVRSIPSVVFLILACVRYGKIKSIAYARITSYSKMFIVKRLIQWTMAVIPVVVMITGFALADSDSANLLWLSRKHSKYFGLAMLL